MNSRLRKQLTLALAVPAALLAAVAGANPGAGEDSRQKAIPITDASVIVEVNATDGDAGLQFFIDADSWKDMKIFSPTGRKIIDVHTKGRLKNYGLTELFSESSEPPFDEFPLEKFKKLFPEGKYRIVGTTIDGHPLKGRANLTHTIPSGPEITAPEDGDVVPRDALVAKWRPVVGSASVNITGYKVIVEREDPLRVFSADLTPSAENLRIPTEFLEAGTEYKLEVIAIEASGNQTLAEVSFSVE